MIKMSETVEFIRECGAFFVLTMNGKFPAGRPFGAIMEYEGDLFISTGDTKKVYSQLKECEKMQIVALKNGTRSWLRVSGEAEECLDIEVKRKMLEECPVLTKHFPTADAPHFTVFRIKVVGTEFYE